MESGEKEMRKAFEDVTTQNVQAVVDHTNETRKMTKEFMDRVSKLENLLLQQNAIIENMKAQLAAVQTAVFRGGTSGN